MVEHNKAEVAAEKIWASIMVTGLILYLVLLLMLAAVMPLLFLALTIYTFAQGELVMGMVTIALTILSSIPPLSIFLPFFMRDTPPPADR